MTIEQRQALERYLFWHVQSVTAEDFGEDEAYCAAEGSDPHAEAEAASGECRRLGFTDDELRRKCVRAVADYRQRMVR